MKKLLETLDKKAPSTQILWWLSLLLTPLWIASQIILSKFYTAFKFPVPYQEAQLSMDPAALQGWYKSLIEMDTLEVYIQTQLIDFAFIITTALLGLIFGMFLYRVSKNNQLGIIARVFAVSIIFLLPLGALFDTLENLVSFFMLNDPTSFPEWLAYMYSSFAWLKFFCLWPGFTVLFVAPAWILLIYLYRR